MDAVADEHQRISRWENDPLPRVVDRLGQERPDGVYSIWATASGLRTITYRQLANAVNGAAGWLVSQLGPGPGGRDAEVLTYVGPTDVRYVVLLIAAVKAGYVLFMTSPRNSLEAHRSLFDRLKCRTLLTSDPVPPPVRPVIDVVDARHLIVPSVDELLGKEYPHFAFDKTFQEAQWDPLLIIHTSGSTGIPKPIIYTHEAWARQVRCVSRPVPGGIPSLDSASRGKRVISMLPLFHGAGISQHIFNAIPFGNIPIAVGTAAIPTAQDIVDTLKQTPAEVVIAVPSVVAELAQNPELLDFCASRLEMILFIGGALPQAIGDTVAAKVQLRCQWGASEVGIPQHVIAPELAGPGGWSYVRFHPCVGAAFDEIADGGYELVIRRDEALADTQPTFAIQNFVQLEKEYRTKDLFVPHPTVPDAWQWCARADDIIVFLNGEKTNPVSMEQHIVARNPELRGAIVVGSQRIQAALLIEPASTARLTTAEQAALIERVWPSVEEANQSASMHARIDKSLILVTPADRPPIRAGKGTIQRASTVAQYAAEIDQLYAQADETLDDDEAPAAAAAAAAPTDAAGVARVIREAVRAVTGWPTLEDADGFFERGMDSLQALRLTRAVRRAFGRQDLALSTIYQHPSVQALAEVVLVQAQDGRNGAESDRDRAEIEPMLATYRRMIQEIAQPTEKKRGAGEPIDVVLTGSTGTVGTFLLHALLGRPGIGHIFCLNRSADAGAVQRAKLADAGLLPAGDDGEDALAARVSFLQADLAAPRLGLDAAAYETIRSRASVVIHNAWPVNFNLPLAAFRPQLSALVHIFSLAAAAARPARVLFVSSVSAVGAAAARSGEPAPELVPTDPDAPYATGYSRAKFLAERLCDAAAAHLSGGSAAVDVAVARVGQVAGPVRRPGLWNPAEWLPTMVRSSAALGCLPDSLGAAFDAVDFVPVDVLADAVVDLATAAPEVLNPPGGVEEQRRAAVFNLRNPHPVPWAALLPAVADALATAAPVSGGAPSPVEVVAPATWLSRLQEAATKEGDNIEAAARRLPALKLLGFFQGLWASQGTEPVAPMAIERALAASPALAALGPVEPGWVRKWVAEWASVWS